MCDGLHIQKQNILRASALLLLFCTAIKAEPAGKSPAGRPAKGWQIRAGCNGLSNDFSMLEAMARKGMNSILTGGAEHFMGVDGQPTKRLADAPTHLEGMERWQRETQALGMQYFPLSNVYGTGDRKRWPLKRNYVTLEGKKWAHTPCPNDAKFWHGKMTNVFVEIARWAKDKPNVPGIILDAEMYGADRTTFPDACFCEDCRKEIVRELGVEDKGMDLKNKKFLKKYREASTRILERIYEQTRLQVHAVHPGFLLGGLILDNVSYDGFTPPFYKAITVAWGTPEVPVLIFSESTYSTGYHSAYARPGKPIVRSTGSYVQGQASKFGQADYPGYIQEWQQRWKDWGAHAEFVGGLWINRIPEENFAENLYHLAKNTRGYWLYDMLSLGDNPPSKLPGNGPAAYWQEIVRANQELDKLLESKGTYVSELKVRSFSLPAPSVSLELWKKVDLPLIKASPPSAEFLSRGAEQIFCIPAARDEVHNYRQLA